MVASTFQKNCEETLRSIVSQYIVNQYPTYNIMLFGVKFCMIENFYNKATQVIISFIYTQYVCCLEADGKVLDTLSIYIYFMLSQAMSLVTWSSINLSSCNFHYWFHFWCLQEKLSWEEIILSHTSLSHSTKHVDEKNVRIRIALHTGAGKNLGCIVNTNDEFRVNSTHNHSQYVKIFFASRNWLKDPPL